MEPLERPERLESLPRLGDLKDLATDRSFELLARLSARIIGVPVALVSVVDSGHQHFIGRWTNSELWTGLTGTPLSHSFCQHVVETASPLLVPDAREHPVLVHNPATAELRVIAYAGVPLTMRSGQVLGSLCVIDHTPRRWQDEEIDILTQLTQLAVARLELAAETERRWRGEKRVRTLAANMEEVISVLDCDGTILFVTDSTKRILGYDPNELVGKSGLSFTHSDDQQHMREVLEGLIEDPSSIHRGEARFRHENGSWRVMEFVAKNLLDEPTVKGIVVHSRDRTEVRAMEKKARQTEKLDSLGRLAGGVAHDFRNVLSVISLSAELLMPELDQAGIDGSDLDAIAEAAKRGTRLTEQLLAFSRSQEVETTVLDPEQVVAEMQTILERMLGSDVRLAFSVEAPVPQIRISRGEFEQVLMNLVSNARDAMPEGGTLTLNLSSTQEISAGAIPVSQPRHTDYLQLTVSDTGHGMSESVKAQAFDPLFTTKPAGEGTGLGLATVYGVVVRSGGRIRLKSAPGEGATFFIYLPAWSGD